MVRAKKAPLKPVTKSEWDTQGKAVATAYAALAVADHDAQKIECMKTAFSTSIRHWERHQKVRVDGGNGTAENILARRAFEPELREPLRAVVDDLRLQLSRLHQELQEKETALEAAKDAHKAAIVKWAAMTPPTDELSF